MHNDTQLVDITREIHPGMAVYPNNAAVVFETLQEAGEGRNGLSKVSLGTHTGTHIDTPLHIHAKAEGALVYPLEQMNGLCEVIDLSHVDSVITAADLPETTQARVLIKTKNSAGDPNVFTDDFVALDDSAARECVERGLQLVGLDALSIRKRGTQNQVHEQLIDNSVVIVEGVWLQDVAPGQYELLCLPIKWNLDGAPARCVLRTIS